MLSDTLRNSGVTPKDFETLLVLSKSATSEKLGESAHVLRFYLFIVRYLEACRLIISPPGSYR